MKSKKLFKSKNNNNKSQLWSSEGVLNPSFYQPNKVILLEHIRSGRPLQTAQSSAQDKETSIVNSFCHLNTSILLNWGLSHIPGTNVRCLPLSLWSQAIIWLQQMVSQVKLTTTNQAKVSFHPINILLYH